MTPAERAAIERAADRVDVSSWAPLNDAERDLVSRVLAPRPAESERPRRAA